MVFMFLNTFLYFCWNKNRNGKGSLLDYGVLWPPMILVIGFFVRSFLRSFVCLLLILYNFLTKFKYNEPTNILFNIKKEEIVNV